MGDPWEVFLLAIGVAAMSWTIAVSHMPLIVPIRKALAMSTGLLGWIGMLVTCPFCTSNWVAGLVMVLCRPRLFLSHWAWLDYFLTWQIMVGFSMFPIAQMKRGGLD